MKVHQHTWQFAKLFLAALVFALGVVACSGGGGGSSGGGGGGGGDNDDNDDLAGIVPATFALSVTTFSVSSSSIVAGDAITLSATVGNAASATTFSSAATLRYYRSSDVTIDSTADTEVGTADSISALAPAATKTETAIDIPTVAGTYYYGACVDGGTLICSAGVQVDVAARDFDLSVTAFSVSKSSIVAGEAITLNATVTNDSSATASSPVAALKYYRSADATIDATDTEVGTADSISVLAAAATSAQTATDSPSTAGTFYYGACVVGAGDSDTSNDCSAGAQVDVAARDFDLSVTAFSVAPSSVVAGNDITFSVTVGNGASAMHSSPVATLRYYRSTDVTITSADTEVGTASIGALAAAATKTETATTIPTIAGDYYYGVCVVAAGDSNSGNNCSTGVRVRVAGQGFDLSITRFVVSSSSVPTNEPITFTATVGNDSSASAFSSVATLKYYRSSDTTITSSDTEVGMADSISALAPAATETETAIDIPSTVGTYYYGACVSSTGDSDTSNDCSAAVQVVVVARNFDLSVTAFSVSESSVPTNEPITFTATVGNASSAMHPSLAATLKYYRSSDATITSTDTEVGVADSIGRLAVAATETETATDSVPAVVGTYYYGACVVAAGDSDTSNDCSAGVQVDVTAIGFDLSVTAFSVSDSSALTNEPITFTATVGNHALATVSSPAATLRYYRSSDATITSADTEVGADSIDALAAAATSAQTATDSPSTAGTYYYGACIVVAGDSVTGNDCSASVQVDVEARVFDLSVTAFSVSDSSIFAGESINLTATVGNASSEMHPSLAATLKYYRSSDATITSTDTEVGVADSISALAAAATSAQTAIDTPTAGTYYYGACVVAVGDSDTSNDCSAGVEVTVTVNGFDLSVTAFSVSDTSVSVNDPITFTATVSNHALATVSSPAHEFLKIYRSTDATISSGDTFVDIQFIGELAVGATETITNFNFAASPAGTYYYYACTDATGDSDTRNDCSALVQVVVAGGEFDLSVTAFSVGDTSVSVNDQITFTTTVGNASSATISSGRISLDYYLSTDATITPSDTLVEGGVYGYSVRLAAGATATETDSIRPFAAGTYYYGACVVAAGESDTSNNCSAGVQVVATHVDLGFDLSVTSFSVSSSSVVAGDEITLRATVGNDSSATRSLPSAAYYSPARYYRSLNATIDSTDTEVGIVILFHRSVAPGDEFVLSSSSDRPAAGTYYYGACVEIAGDSDTSNNCSAGVQVVVTASSP